MTPAKLRWGLLFIAFGVLIILYNLDYIHHDYWWHLLSWWPIVLIAIGIEKIFQKTKLQVIAYLSPVLLVAFMFYLAADPVNIKGRSNSLFSFTDEWSVEKDSDISRLKAVINHNRCDLNIGRERVDLVSAEFNQSWRRPDIDYWIEDKIARLEIASRDRIAKNRDIRGRLFQAEWLIDFSSDVPLELICTGNKSEMDLNLADLQVSYLEIDNNDGTIDLKLGGRAAESVIQIDGDNIHLNINIPEQIGLKVTGADSDNYLAEYGLIKQTDYFINDQYLTAASKIDITVPDNLKQMTIKTY